MTIIFCMTIKYMFIHKEKLNLTHALTVNFVDICTNLYSRHSALKLGKQRRYVLSGCISRCCDVARSRYPSWKYRKVSVSVSWNVTRYWSTFLSIFKGGIKFLWSRNILICVTLKTYLLCFPKYGPLAASWCTFLVQKLLITP